MAVPHQQTPDLSTLDAAALRVLVMAQRTELLGKDAEIAKRDIEIESLKLLLLKLKRMQFGRRSEKLTTEIEQLTLKLEELEADAAKPADVAADESAEAVSDEPAEDSAGAAPNKSASVQHARKTGKWQLSANHSAGNPCGESVLIGQAAGDPQHGRDRLGLIRFESEAIDRQK